VVADLIVEGSLLDADGARSGYARLRGGRLIETGSLGTDSTRGRLRRVRGIVVPSPVNGHTHLGDAVATREPPLVPLAEIVRPPDGYKFRLLRDTLPAAKQAGMRGALEMMARQGVAATIDFREEGVEGARLLRAAGRGLSVRTVLLGRPTRRPVRPVELRELLKVADGVGLSSIGEESAAARAVVARACRSHEKWFALHASESTREPVDDYLDPRPDLLVHLAKATPDDLLRVVDAGVSVAVCPRSNALFGRRPDLARFERLGVHMLLGTDNAMFHSPSIWRELEFAYVTGRLVRRPVRPEFLFRAAFVHPYEWLGVPERAGLVADGPVRPLAFRLPTDDPAYQIVARATEHVMMRAEPSPPTSGEAV
jgi:cytosine/adenosine deaminase-related metal-dependent hydrolase